MSMLQDVLDCSSQTLLCMYVTKENMVLGNDETLN